VTESLPSPALTHAQLSARNAPSRSASEGEQESRGAGEGRTSSVTESLPSPALTHAQLSARNAPSRSASGVSPHAQLRPRPAAAAALSYSDAKVANRNGFRVGDELTGPFHDARRFPSTRL
jgi:hypothetical protein